VAGFDRIIPPGTEGKITLEMRTERYQGTIHKRARLFTNDPEHPRVVIGMKGKVWTPVHIKPYRVYLKGILGEEVEKVVNLHGEKKEPLTVKIASVSIPDKVAVELLEIEKGRRYQLKVKNKITKEDVYRGQVKLTTNYPEKPELVIPILGSIRPPVEVRPKDVNFGRITEHQLLQLKKSGKPMRRSVIVLLNKGNDLKIKKVEREKSLFNVVTRQIQPGRAVQLVIEPVFEKLKTGTNTDHLRIYTNQKRQESFEIPVRFEVY